MTPVLTVRYEVQAYDAAYGGYGEDRSRTFGGRQEAVDYARGIPGNFAPSVWKVVTMQPIRELVPHSEVTGANDAKT